MRKIGLVKSLDSTVTPDIDLEELNSYFVSAAGDPLEFIDYEYFDRVVPKYHSSFIFKSLSCYSVKETIIRIASSSMGPDGFDIKMYKILLPHILQCITDLFNFSLSSGCFPLTRKRSYVVLISKVSSPTNYSDYRPISLTCTLSKSLERCVHDQIINYFITNG